MQFFLRITYREKKPGILSNYYIQSSAFLFGDSETQVQLPTWQNENRRRKYTEGI